MEINGLVAVVGEIKADVDQ
jgi:hypothetical protein